MSLWFVQRICFIHVRFRKQKIYYPFYHFVSKILGFNPLENQIEPLPKRLKPLFRVNFSTEEKFDSQGLLDLHPITIVTGSAINRILSRTFRLFDLREPRARWMQAKEKEIDGFILKILENNRNDEGRRGRETRAREKTTPNRVKRIVAETRIL